MAVDPIGFAPMLASALSATGRSGVGTLPPAGADLEWRRCAITRTQLAVPGARSTPEVAVAGSPVARRLVREVVTGPDGLRRVDVIGPGGYGKTALLDALAAAFAHRRHRGPPRAARARAGARPRDRAAGRRRPPVLSGRAGAVEPVGGGPLGYLVVAHRPWPRPTGIAALGAALAARRPPVVLDVLDRAGVASRATLRVGEPASSSGSRRRRWSSWCSSGPRGCRYWSTGCSTRWSSRPGRTGPGSRCPSGRRPGCWPSSGTRWPPRSRACAGCCWPEALGAPVEAEVLVPLLGLADAGGAGRAAGVGARRRPADRRRAGRPAGLGGGAGPHPGRLPVRAAARAGRDRAGPGRQHPRARPRAARRRRQRGPGGLGVQRGRGRGAARRRPGGRRVPGRRGARRHAGHRAGRPPGRGRGAGRRPRRRAHPGRPGAGRADRVPADDLVRAGTAAAAVLARRGMLARSAELHRWMGAATGQASAIAVPALIGTGALDEARGVLRGSRPGPAGIRLGRSRRRSARRRCWPGPRS